MNPLITLQRDAENPLNVAVIGAGSHGYRNILPALMYLPVRLRAVCDADAARAGQAARQYGAVGYADTADMYKKEKLDAVFMCVSPALHPRLAAEAFGAGLDVWMEKPPALHAAQLGPMIAARGDRIAVVGFKKAFMPATEKVLEIFSRPPEAGPLRSILAEYPLSIPQGDPATMPPTNWLANGCHPLSLLRAVGGPVSAITVHRGKHEGGAAILEFAGGAIGNLHLAAGAPYFTRERYSFFGNGVQVEIENGDRVTLHRGIPFEYGRTVNFAPPGRDTGSIVWEPQNFMATIENIPLITQGTVGSMRYFCQCVRTRTPADRGSLEFAADVMHLYEAAMVADGQRVAVEPR
jgi:predicted dehydrogenase